jgi:hypothetical protein
VELVGFEAQDLADDEERWTHARKLSVGLLPEACERTLAQPRYQNPLFGSGEKERLVLRPDLIWQYKNV